jgi:hypothetical protein
VFATVLSLGHPYFGEVHFFNGLKYHDSLWGDVDITTRLMKGGWHIATMALAASALALWFALTTIPVCSWLGQSAG